MKEVTSSPALGPCICAGARKRPLRPRQKETGEHVMTLVAGLTTCSRALCIGKELGGRRAAMPCAMDSVDRSSDA